MAHFFRTFPAGFDFLQAVLDVFLEKFARLAQERFDVRLGVLLHEVVQQIQSFFSVFLATDLLEDLSQHVVIGSGQRVSLRLQRNVLGLRNF